MQQGATLVPLPMSLFASATEESLLLAQLRRDCADKRSLPAEVTMYTRNDLVALACKLLGDDAKQLFLDYASQLDEHMEDSDHARLPLPIWQDGVPRPSEAFARDALEENSGALWPAVRMAVRGLEFEYDTRSAAQGYTFRLGLFSKGGLVGMAKATSAHLNVCRLVNTMIAELAGPHFAHTSLAINVNDCVAPHRDLCNAAQCGLLVGLSHHQGGHFWYESESGSHYLETKVGFLRGTLVETASRAFLFPSRSITHAALKATSGDRFVIVAYTTANFAKATPAHAELLRTAGFHLPMSAPVTWLLRVNRAGVGAEAGSARAVAGFAIHGTDSAVASVRWAVTRDDDGPTGTSAEGPAQTTATDTMSRAATSAVEAISGSLQPSFDSLTIEVHASSSDEDEMAVAMQPAMSSTDIPHVHQPQTGTASLGSGSPFFPEGMGGDTNDAALSYYQAFQSYRGAESQASTHEVDLDGMD
ncbi:unnamed protein product [Symbiodinium sp. CCMP2592]|nr:unnamed protein product [Symbiodinium sp. CCMP2592]